MKSTPFLLGLLFVGLAQYTLCCGASVRKGRKSIPDKAYIKQGFQSQNTKPKAMMPFVRCCQIKKKRAVNTPSLVISSSGSVKPATTSSSQNTVKLTQTKKQAAASNLLTTPTSYLASFNKDGILQHSRKGKAVLSEDDPCGAWMNCPVHQHPKIKAWLRSLPACPCTFSPASLYYSNTIYDKIHGRFFSWRIANTKYEMLSVYKPTADICIRQLPNAVNATPATQQCCYDTKNRLITQGSGAGTPLLVAPELDVKMHYHIDLKPYISCQGDWTRYQAVRRPNNGYNCTSNPKKKEFERQKKKARNF